MTPRLRILAAIAGAALAGGALWLALGARTCGDTVVERLGHTFLLGARCRP